jgi:hypothetical protein
VPPIAAPLARLESLIVADLLSLFEEFRGWRRSCDAFGSAEFHCRCGGRANTLTLIRNKRWNVLGGFTPVEWDSRG